MMKKTENGEEQSAFEVAAVSNELVQFWGDVMNYWHFMYPMSLFSFGPLFDKKI